MTVMQSEYELLRNRFQFRLNEQKIKSGKRPTVCLMGESDYCAMQFLGRDECTIKDMNLNYATPGSSGAADMSYYGVDIYQSIGLDCMIFGS